MILIADSGSTNTSWCLIPQNSHQKEKYLKGHEIDKLIFSTEGYNPYFVSQDYIVKSLLENLPEGYDWSTVTKVGFYGAGCSENKYEFVREALKRVFTNAEVEVAMDLLAAARALLGRDAGFAAILGTGTNSCLYDGNEITMNIDSLGFMLGDEGSGAYIGRRLLRDFLRGDMPNDIKELFNNEYSISEEDIFENVYEKPFVNKYCASYCLFINKYYKKNQWLNFIVEDSFRDLFRNIISKYPNFSSYKFNCVGSVSYYFTDALERICEENGMKLGKILQSPIDGLIKYYVGSNGENLDK
jgi:N-acetylglucosamine kinase-like BadF-type ATPase